MKSKKEIRLPFIYISDNRDNEEFKIEAALEDEYNTEEYLEGNDDDIYDNMDDDLYYFD